MDKILIRTVLEQYLESLYRTGTEEEQDEVIEALNELEK